MTVPLSDHSVPLSFISSCKAHSSQHHNLNGGQFAGRRGSDTRLLRVKSVILTRPSARSRTPGPSLTLPLNQLDTNRLRGRGRGRPGRARSSGVGEAETPVPLGVRFIYLSAFLTVALLLRPPAPSLYLSLSLSLSLSVELRDEGAEIAIGRLHFRVHFCPRMSHAARAETKISSNVTHRGRPVCSRRRSSRGTCPAARSSRPTPSAR